MHRRKWQGPSWLVTLLLALVVTLVLVAIQGG